MVIFVLTILNYEMTLEENIHLKRRAAYISLIVGILMFIGKITAYFLTDSKAIFSDAAESVVHVLATSMALYSIILSSRPPDKSHLYGHGNVEYFSAGIEGLLIILAALVIIYTSIEGLITGIELKALDYGTIIIAAAGIVNLVLGFYLIKKGRQTNSLALVADGKHVLTDSYTSIGVMIGLIIVLLTGIEVIDPIFAIIVALNILFTGFKLIRESIGGLMNETDVELLNKLSMKFDMIKKDDWIDLHHLRFWQSAEHLFADFHLTLPYYYSIQQSHEIEQEIEKRLNEDFTSVQVRIHFDYCSEELCPFCRFSNCKVRKYPFEKSYSWNSEKLIGEPIQKLIGVKTN